MSSGRSDPVVLDASAVIAALRDEPGAQALRDFDGVPTVSAVNLAEVRIVLARLGVPSTAIKTALQELDLDVLPFIGAFARSAAEIHARGRKRGLSLADAACLATARAIGAEAWTADTGWRGLDVGVTIRLIR
jgi:PIN domain nuclease of toxin-antitoxin system